MAQRQNPSWEHWNQPHRTRQELLTALFEDGSVEAHGPSEFVLLSLLELEGQAKSVASTTWCPRVGAGIAC